jgi:hypothetical protein
MRVALERRATILAQFGASPAVREELLRYDPGDLAGARLPRAMRLPLQDEAFVSAWREYGGECAVSGFRALARRLVQLRFPVREGMSQTEDYQAATRRGTPVESMPTAVGIDLARADACTVTIHQTWAGSVPVIQAGCREDFVTLLRAFTARNEPVPVPSSQGACIVSGYNNWDRVRRFRDDWIRDNPAGTFSLDLVRNRHDAYQDRFILLSTGPYSGVPAEAVGLTHPDWLLLSQSIRREHECAHYWTRRVLSSMGNRVFDELVADYCGLFAACGRLRADWLLRFLGLDAASGGVHGRLPNYRGNPPLSDEAFALLQRLTVAAVEHLDVFDRRHAVELTGRRGLLLILLTLSRMSLEATASRDAGTQLVRHLRHSRAFAAHAVGGSRCEKFST